MRPRLVVKHVVDNRVLSAEEPKDTSVRGAKVWARLRGRETPISCENDDFGPFLGYCYQQVLTYIQFCILPPAPPRAALKTADK